MSDDWRTAVAAERMELDREFTDRVAASSLDGQQWNLAMTALEFEIEDPDDPERATVRPDVSSLDAVLPELDAVGGPAAGGVPAAGGGGTDDGLVDRVKGALGLGGGAEDRREEIEELAALYADRLEEKLRSTGRWEGVCERAAE